MSYLQVADGSVSTRDECDGRDAQGYPRTARRRLRKNHDDAGTVTDIDTGQRFKVRKTKEGDRIVPLFDKRMHWKSASGYDALRLCLSCLGAPGEYVLWDEATGAEMTREEWCKRKFGSQNERIVLEVDGPQHFWKDYWMYTERKPERDAEKARWALARGQWVVRVLADDVYHDRNGWRAWLRRAIDKARAGAAPRVLTPDAPEYRSPESAYIDPHANDTNA